MAGAGDRGLDGLLVAGMEVEEDVAGGAVPDLRSAGRDGGIDIGHRRQRVDLEDYSLGGVLRPVPGLGDDDGDRISDMAHAADGQRRPGRNRRGRAVPVP